MNTGKIHQTNIPLLLQIINRLAQQKTLNLLVAISYALFILFLHDPIVQITLKIKDRLTLPVFNFIVGSLSALVLIVFLALLINQLLKNTQQRSLRLFYLFVTTGCIVLHTQIMFEMSIEIIHSFEYSLLAFFLFPFFRRYGAAVIFSLPVMFIDEWLQYEVMYKGYVEYYELNDILMDVFGCGFMMLILWIFNIESKGLQRPWWKNGEYIFLFSVGITFWLLMMSCVIVLYPADSCPHTWMILNKLKNPHAFWQIHPHHGSIYHVLQPITGLFLIGLACLYFASMDYWQTKRAVV